MADKILITTAENHMTEQLKQLWKTVFGDSDQYISLFFEKRFAPSQCVVALDGEKVAGMLFLLPFELVMQQQRYGGRYIYAVATHPDYRRRGISGDMLEFAHQKAAEEGAALSALVPASRELFDYYGKRGFSTEFYKREITLDTDVSSDIVLETASLDKMLTVRRGLFSESKMFVDWDEQALYYQQLENGLLGGETLCFPAPYEGYALCLAADDRVFVREWGARELYPELLAAIAARYQKGKITVRLAAEKDEPGAVPFAMTKWYITERKAPRGAPAFISLVLD